MSQSIDMSAVTEATLNGSTVEKINLNGTEIWTGGVQLSGKLYFPNAVTETSVSYCLDGSTSDIHLPVNGRRYITSIGGNSNDTMAYDVVNKTFRMAYNIGVPSSNKALGYVSPDTWFMGYGSNGTQGVLANDATNVGWEGRTEITKIYGHNNFLWYKTNQAIWVVGPEIELDVNTRDLIPTSTIMKTATVHFYDPGQYGFGAKGWYLTTVCMGVGSGTSPMGVPGQGCWKLTKTIIDTVTPQGTAYSTQGFASTPFTTADIPANPSYNGIGEPTADLANGWLHSTPTHSSAPYWVPTMNGGEGGFQAEMTGTDGTNTFWIQQSTNTEGWRASGRQFIRADGTLANNTLNQCGGIALDLGDLG